MKSFSLRSLFFFFTAITIYIGIASSLHGDRLKKQTLEELALKCNHEIKIFTKEPSVWQWLLFGRSRIRSIEIDHFSKDGFCDEMFPIISTLAHLEELHLAGTTRNRITIESNIAYLEIDETQLAYDLSKLNNLKELRISAGILLDESMIPENPSLESIHLMFAKIPDGLIYKLTSITSLRELWTWECEIEMKASAQFAEESNIEKLTLRCIHIARPKDLVLDPFLTGWKSLRELSLENEFDEKSQSMEYDYEIVKKISELPNIETLYIGPKLTEEE